MMTYHPPPNKNNSCRSQNSSNYSMTWKARSCLLNPYNNATRNKNISDCLHQNKTKTETLAITTGTEEPIPHLPAGGIWTMDQSPLLQARPPMLDDPSVRQHWTHYLNRGSSHTGRCGFNNFQTWSWHQQIHVDNKLLWWQVNWRDLIEDWVWFKSHGRSAGMCQSASSGIHWCLCPINVRSYLCRLAPPSPECRPRC